MTKFITKKYMNNRQMEKIKRKNNDEHIAEDIINACTLCGDTNGDEWVHVMFRCPITIWLADVTTMLSKHLAGANIHKGTTHIASTDGIPADLKVPHYLDITKEYKNQDKEVLTKIAWLNTIAHTLLLDKDNETTANKAGTQSKTN